MNIAFSGSRRFIPTLEMLERALVVACALRRGPVKGRPPPTHVLVGDCPSGVDAKVRAWCGYSLDDSHVYRADWDRHDKAAGPIRNEAMLSDADVLVAFPDKASKGTRSAISIAEKMGLPIIIFPAMYEIVIRKDLERVER